MIGNVNVPGASAADIATVSSVANEALNKANQALNSNGSGNTELNLELSSIKYYPSDFVNMTYKDGYYLVASGKYLYFTSDFSEWNRVVIKKDDSNYTYKYNFVYVVGNMLVCCYVNSSNSLYRQNGFNGFGNNKVDIFTGAQSSGYRNMISMDTISANMSFRRTHDSNGIYSYYNNYYY